MTAGTIFLYYKFHKYYLWPKHAANNLGKKSYEEREALAQRNKRNFGFFQRYKPSLEISTRRNMYIELGGK